ncbi:MAG: 3'-5' exonuclease [Thermoanaerobaculia bacterium]
MIDVETSGFSRQKCDIVEIAVVHPEGPTVVFDTLLRPLRRIGNREIHGITNRDVRHAPRLAEVAGALLDVLCGRVIVAHNAAFDLAFLQRALVAAGHDVPLPHLCTMGLLDRLTGRRLALEDACAAQGVPLHRGRHRAAEDALATAQLLRTLLLEPGARAAIFEMVPSDPVPAGAGHGIGGRAPLRPRSTTPIG